MSTKKTQHLTWDKICNISVIGAKHNVMIILLSLLEDIIGLLIIIIFFDNTMLYMAAEKTNTLISQLLCSDKNL